MSKIRSTFWDIINHNVTIGAIIVGVILFINTGDKASNDAIIELQTKQVVIMEDIDVIQNNHLVHIQDCLEDIQKQIATLMANQRILLENIQ